MENQVKNRFSPSQKVVSPEGRKPAQQQFKDDTDINSIMRKFQKTGTINHSATHQPEYGIATGPTLHQAMNLVTKANSMFEELPSSIRNKFKNQPSAFLDFVQDHNNAAEAEELGLELSTEAKAKAEQIAAQAASQPPTPAPVVAESPLAPPTPVQGVQTPIGGETPQTGP